MVLNDNDVDENNDGDEDINADNKTTVTTLGRFCVSIMHNMLKKKKKKTLHKKMTN
jgi:hypothetical protein